jgi:hypothetical protein
MTISQTLKSRELITQTLSEPIVARDPDKPAQYITKIVAKHREMLRRVALGEQPQEIADSMGLTKRRVNAIINSPLFKLNLEEFQAKLDADAYDVMSELRAIQPDAVDAIKDSITQLDLPNLRFQAARDLLNRTGATVPKQFEVKKFTESYEQRLLQLRVEDENTQPIHTLQNDDDSIEIINVDPTEE